MTEECLKGSYQYFLPRPIIPIDQKSGFDDILKSGQYMYGFTGSKGEFGLKYSNTWINSYKKRDSTDIELAHLKQGADIDRTIRTAKNGFVLTDIKNNTITFYDNLIECWLAFYKIGCDDDTVALSIETARIEASKAFAVRNDVFLSTGNDRFGEEIWFQVLCDTEEHLLCRTVLTYSLWGIHNDNIVALRKKDKAYVGGIRFVSKDNRWVASNQTLLPTENTYHEDLGQALRSLFIGISKKEILTGHAKMALYNKGEWLGVMFGGARRIDERSDVSGIATDPNYNLTQIYPGTM